MGPGVVHQHHARRVLRAQDARVGGAQHADDLEAGRCPGGGEDPQDLRGIDRRGPVVEGERDHLLPPVVGRPGGGAKVADHRSRHRPACPRWRARPWRARPARRRGRRSRGRRARRPCLPVAHDRRRVSRRACRATAGGRQLRKRAQSSDRNQAPCQRPGPHTRGAPARRQLLGTAGKQRPGDRRSRPLTAAGRLQQRPPLHEVVPVIAAGHPRTGDHRAGLGQRGRLAAKLPGQVDRPAALVRIGSEAVRHARFVAATQARRSTVRDRHSDPARYDASCVLPHDPGQSCAPTAASRPGTSATAAPGTSAASRPGTVSGRAMKPSASGGTGPDRTGHATPRRRGPAGSAGRAWPSAGINP